MAQALGFSVLSNLVQVAGVLAVEDSADERLIRRPGDYRELVVGVLDDWALSNVDGRGALGGVIRLLILVRLRQYKRVSKQKHREEPTERLFDSTIHKQLSPHPGKIPL